MNNPSVAYQNSLKRPLRTSPLNPYVARRTGYGSEIRVSPRLSALRAQGFKGVDATAEAIMREGFAKSVPDARLAIADRLRNYRRYKMLSARDRLVALNARLDEVVDFARGDYIVPFMASRGHFDVSKNLKTFIPNRSRTGSFARTGDSYAAELMAGRASDTIRAARTRRRDLKPGIGGHDLRDELAKDFWSMRKSASR